MTPKKIYLLGQDLEFLADKSDIYLCDVSTRDVLGGQTPYILESEHNRIVEELKAEIERLKESNDAITLDNDLFKENQTPSELKDFVNEAMYIIGLYKDKRFANAELSKAKLFEMFDDVMIACSKDK